MEGWGGGSLSGQELHLLPDGSYLYCEWADIEPLTIYDKGSWSYADGAIELASDSGITWDPGIPRSIPVFRRANRPRESALAPGYPDLPSLRAELAEDEKPELSLLALALVREERYSMARAETIRDKLLATAWRPEYHMSGDTHP